jgi:uncharacterized protein with PQ loop repeat
MYDLGKQKSINYYVVAFILVEAVVVLSVFGVELHDVSSLTQSWGTIRLCGYCKAAITLVKYMPQVYLNWKRQSTVGWSLENVMLDFTGGFFSFVQQAVESIALGQSLFGGGDAGFNIVKFLLSVIAMFFDLIFMFQHYCLYRDAWQKEKNVDDRLANLEKVNNTFSEMKESGRDGKRFLSSGNGDKLNTYKQNHV